MFEVVFVVGEYAAGVEGRVDVDTLHTSDVLVGELGQAGEGFEHVAAIASDEQVVVDATVAPVTDMDAELEVVSLAGARVVFIDPGVVVGILTGGNEGLVFPHPREFEGASKIASSHSSSFPDYRVRSELNL